VAYSESREEEKEEVTISVMSMRKRRGEERKTMYCNV